MSHMFTISDNESETSDDVAEAKQSKEKPGDRALPEIVLPGPDVERLRGYSDSQASSSSQGEDGEPHGGPVFEEGGEEGQGLRARSQSAPPELWAAMRYGRQLRRMSDEFDTFMDKEAMKKVGGAKMRTSFSWFSFWRRKDTDTDLSSNDSGVDSRGAE